MKMHIKGLPTGESFHAQKTPFISLIILLVTCIQHKIMNIYNSVFENISLLVHFFFKFVRASLLLCYLHQQPWEQLCSYKRENQFQW